MSCYHSAALLTIYGKRVTLEDVIFPESVTISRFQGNRRALFISFKTLLLLLVTSKFVIDHIVKSYKCPQLMLEIIYGI